MVNLLPVFVQQAAVSFVSQSDETPCAANFAVVFKKKHCWFVAAGLASGKHLCRILRQQDCLTAHPRHGNIQVRLRHTDAVILTAGGGRWLSCPNHAHSILLLPWRTGLYGFSLSWVMALPVLPCTDFRRTGLSLVPLKLSYWRTDNRKTTR